MIFNPSAFGSFKRITFSLPLVYCALFFLTYFIGSNYESISQLDYTHTLLINCCIYSSLGCYVLHKYSGMWAEFFAVLQVIACTVYMMMALVFIYASQSYYELFTGYFVITNYSLILLDVVALLGIAQDGG